MQQESQVRSGQALILAIIFVILTTIALHDALNGNGRWWSVFLSGSATVQFARLSIRNFRRGHAPSLPQE
ncbi:hypothetical protein SAMN05421753_114112 [Planctomicrobium piriforme]|uniref:Uncharacterized protein n=1 Tax=Planctomicrobium piriforme TaxID=1576369 RepID=A0A1I3MV13_9PLAN|nr:hypothetical protein SAMN05421753_114112 [Planctomicrobium piriforme]